MESRIYSFDFQPDWMVLSQDISQIDRFDASWTAIEKREGQSLKYLKEIATVSSVGASTRIEGSKMTDTEVGLLIKKLDISKLEERDQQEVAGYYRALDLIAGSYKDIEVSEGDIKNLHNVLLGFSSKDAWHRGGYKQQSNAVEATREDGTKYVIFKTTDPGFMTEEAMRNLVQWYKEDTKTPALIRIAAFIYELLSIHPFQDGNGRMSRLLSTLLLLKQGYSWVQYVSFEHEIERRKKEYYQVLMQCQGNRPGEDVAPWVVFFLDCLKNIQGLLMQKLDTQVSSKKMSPREKVIYSVIENYPGIKSAEIADKVNIALPTVKKILSEMNSKKLIYKHGNGAGTNYSVEQLASMKHDLFFKLTDSSRIKEFSLLHPTSFIEIKKIILTPLFEWANPDDWAKMLIKNGLYLQINCRSAAGPTASLPLSISSYNDPNLYQPVFTLIYPINMPTGLWEDLWGRSPYLNEYPMTVSILLVGTPEHFDFDVSIIYNEA